MDRRTSLPRGARSIRAVAAVALAFSLFAGSAVAAAAAGPGFAGVPAGATAGAATRVVALAVGVPPRPTGVTLRTVKVTHFAGGGGRATFRISWHEPAGAATRFRVIGLLSCVNELARTNGKPCVVAHMHLRARDLRVIATYGGSVRAATITVRLFGEITTNALWGNSDYFGILLGAYNSHGESILAIAASSKVCWGCTY